jgi:hypothetical protein
LGGLSGRTKCEKGKERKKVKVLSNKQNKRGLQLQKKREANGREEKANAGLKCKMFSNKNEKKGG